mmetsp:Transcript_39794/g.65984  ORF Transcript_39794/g.65984 Transcript_39794/m.65984 type:complete len:316 (-) Transcript_39794:121-1068(-)
MDGYDSVDDLGAAATLHVCSVASKGGLNLAELSSVAYHTYGPGAFFVAFENEEAVHRRDPWPLHLFALHLAQAASPDVVAPEATWDELDAALQNRILLSLVDTPEVFFAPTIMYRRAEPLSMELDDKAAKILLEYNPAETINFVGQAVAYDPAKPETRRDVLTNLNSTDVAPFHDPRELDACLRNMAEQGAHSQKVAGNALMKKQQTAEARKHYEEGLRQLAQVFEPCTLRWQLHQNLSLCDLRDEAWEQCAKRCRQLVDRGGDTDTAKLRYRLALALSKSGKHAEAQPHIEKAAEMEPDDSSVKDLLQHVRSFC